MSDDFLKKCSELEDKLKKMHEDGKHPDFKKPQPKVVVNAMTRSEDDARAQQLANSLLLKARGMFKPQPTDEEMFGHMVVTEEQAKAAEDEWNNKISGFFREATRPIEKVQKNDWGRSGPIKEEDLTEEEQRIRKIAVDPRLLEDS